MNHISNCVFLSFCVFYIGSAQALLGNYIPREKIPDGVCSIDMFDMVDKHQGSCTGTLISSRHVLTAAHCVGGLGDIQTLYSVTCGSGKNAVSVIGHSEAYHEDFVGSQLAPEPSNFDLGMITLEEEITSIPTLEISESPEQTEQILSSPGVNCIAYGDGVDNNGFGGRMHGVQVKMVPGLVTMERKVLIPTKIPGVYKQGKKIYSDLVIFDPRVNNPLMPGDSGGPLVCRVEGGRDVVVGVHSMGISQLNIDVDPGANYDWILEQMY